MEKALLLHFLERINYKTRKIHSEMKCIFPEIISENEKKALNRISNLTDDIEGLISLLKTEK